MLCKTEDMEIGWWREVDGVWTERHRYSETQKKKVEGLRDGGEESRDAKRDPALGLPGFSEFPSKLW